MERHCHGSLSGREVAVVPHQWNLLEIHPQNLLEICCLGCYGKLFTGRCLSPLQNHPRGGHQGKLMATGGCWLPCTAELGLWGNHPSCRHWTLEKAPAQQEPAEQAQQNQEGRTPSSCLSLQSCLLTMLRTVPTGKGKNI